MSHELRPKARWLETRLPVRRLWRAFLRESIPGGARWAYVFGSLCLALLGTQLLTGIALACFYVPSPDHALQSLTYLATDIPWGRVVLGLHHWSANLLVGVVGLHLVQTFVWGAYKRPREIVWWSGVGLLLLVQAFHFTGFALPWDQAGYWATQVGTSIVGAIPAVGPYLMKVLRGGQELGAITLTHFYALHIVVLPGIVGVFVLLHLICLRMVGSAGGWRPAQPASPSDFYPYQVTRDATAIVIVLVGLMLLAVFAYAPPTTPADPTDTSVLPRPEWNFLFFFQLLHYFPGNMEWLGVLVVPGALVVLLALLPFLDRHPDRHPARRRVTIIIGGGVLSSVMLLTALALLSDRAAVAFVFSPSVRAGAHLFVENDCASCHKIRGEGSSSGSDLSFIGAAHDIDWLKTYIRDPDSLNANSSMPPYKRLSPTELEQLAAYLRSLR